MKMPYEKMRSFLNSGVRRRTVWVFVKRVLQRYQEDGCNVLAASLSYTVLLALVPLLAVGLGMLAAFPAFADAREALLAILLANLVPDVGADLESAFRVFIENAGGMTGFGIVGLGITALLLLNSTQRAFAVIWRAPLEGHLLNRLPSYWAVLTLGPLLFGVSLSLSSYLFAILSWVESPLLEESVGWGLRRLPLVFAVFGFAVLYWLMPSRPVKFLHACAGGMLAALLFELGKTGFGLYVAFFPSYEIIYGALAAAPVFFIWIYISLSITLLGAEFTAVLGESRSVRAGRPSKTSALGNEAWQRFAASLSVLAALHKAAGTGESLERAFLEDLPLMAQTGSEMLPKLIEVGYVVETSQGGYVLCRDLTQVCLKTFLCSLDLWPFWDEEESIERYELSVMVRGLACFKVIEVKAEDVLGQPLSDFVGS